MFPLSKMRNKGKIILIGKEEKSNHPIKVVHCKQERYDILIDRRTKWGNPFVIDKDNNRKEVLKKYRNWIVKQKTLLSDLKELKGKILGCWCKPKDCHGDILKELIEKGENNEMYMR